MTHNTHNVSKTEIFVIFTAGFVLAIGIFGLAIAITSTINISKSVDLPEKPYLIYSCDSFEEEHVLWLIETNQTRQVEEIRDLCRSGEYKLVNKK